MRKIGLSSKKVFENIEKFRQQDIPWDKVLNSICTKPHAIATQAFTEAIDTNLGDIRIFRGTYQIEQQVIEMIGSLLGGKESSGSLVSGGTEANLLAMYVARKVAQLKQPGMQGGEVIVAETVHYSLVKIFDLLGLKQVTVPVDSALRMDTSNIPSLINKNTIAIIATAGNSEFGSIDPIKTLSDIAISHDVYLHVDAATGGFIIPFAKALGHELSDFDFSLPGVSSITMDPHKYGLANIPAGGIFFRNASLHNLISLDSFFIGTPTHRTFLGTRPGGSAVATYAVMEHLGWDGYIDITRENFEHIEYLVDNLQGLGFDILLPPELNIVIVDLPNAPEVMKLLESWDWIISVSKRFQNCLRLVVTNHVNIPMIDNVLAVLVEAIQTVGADAVSIEEKLEPELER